jgi:hypothetical protein
MVPVTVRGQIGRFVHIRRTLSLPQHIYKASLAEKDAFTKGYIILFLLHLHCEWKVFLLISLVRLSQTT